MGVVVRWFVWYWVVALAAVVVVSLSAGGLLVAYTVKRQGASAGSSLVGREGASARHGTPRRELIANAAETCATGYNGDALSTVQPYAKPRKVDIQLHPCAEFTELGCCSNVMAQEIGDGFDHLFNIGGSGGVPVDDERCIQHAKENYIAMKDYFCLFCNPRQIKYLACCKPEYAANGTCHDPATKTTTRDMMTLHGEAGCTGMKPDTIRVCKDFAKVLWGTPKAGDKAETNDGSKYDSCGMMMWVLGGSDSVAAENAWSEPGANPNEVLPWGDVDGRSGDDPVTPSQHWGRVEDFFHDVRPPLFDQFRVVVVDDDETGETCFNGYMVRGSGEMATVSLATSALLLLATVATMN